MWIMHTTPFVLIKFAAATLSTTHVQVRLWKNLDLLSTTMVNTRRLTAVKPLKQNFTQWKSNKLLTAVYFNVVYDSDKIMILLIPDHKIFRCIFIIIDKK